MRLRARNFLALCLGLGLAIAGPAASAAASGRAEKFSADARRELEQNRIDSAVLLFQKAVVANPKNPAPYVELAGIEAGRGNFSLAEKFFSIALGIDPTNRSALAGDGLVAVSQSKADRARTRLDQLEQIYGECAEVVKLRAALGKS